ncbi:unnamed protein product [Linum trigynum]|uniref:Uncharacterized protein n=1 Tax=Linum trigynum TaxID=586398 RepID=A0AAV2DVV2_9ROSI
MSFVKDRCDPQGDARLRRWLGFSSTGVAIPSISIPFGGYQHSRLRNGCWEAGPCCVIEGRNGWRRNI